MAQVIVLGLKFNGPEDLLDNLPFPLDRLTRLGLTLAAPMSHRLHVGRSPTSLFNSHFNQVSLLNLGIVVDVTLLLESALPLI